MGVQQENTLQNMTDNMCGNKFSVTQVAYIDSHDSNSTVIDIHASL